MMLYAETDPSLTIHAQTHVVPRKLRVDGSPNFQSDQEVLKQSFTG